MSVKLTTEQFIQKAKLLHGDKYDYSLTTYINSQTKVKIICKNRGTFEQRPNDHLKGYLGGKRGRTPLTTVEFIDKAVLVHRLLYDYTLVDYNNMLCNIKIVCKKHGMFEQTPNNHLLGHGCPICKSSKGELKIYNWLTDNNIIFETQKKFDKCRSKQPLPFDFYLPDHNLCIEFDGKQHFKISTRSKDHSKNLKEFERIKHNDKIKDEFCSKTKTHLIRISFKEICDVENILSNYLG
jgi:very-short-patch-repair endonuclease